MAMLTRRSGLLAGLAAGLAAPAARAQDAPGRPITLVVPFAPGGASDVTARILAARMSEVLRQRILIENRPGAGGALGAEVVARAPATGTTLLFWNVGFVTTAHLARLSYDHLRDFEPVGLAGTTPTILSVNRDVPAQTLAEFLALAKRRPGEINFGSSGIGASDHLAIAFLERLADIRMTHVPYRGGAPAATAAIAGEVQLLGLSAGTVLEHVRSGRLRALAIGGERRYAGLPEVPTAAEAGLPGYVVDVWLGIWAPAGTPRPVVEQLNAAMREALAAPEVQRTLGAAGIEPLGSTVDEFAARVRSESERWGRVIREANITIQ